MYNDQPVRDWIFWSQDVASSGYTQLLVLGRDTWVAEPSGQTFRVHSASENARDVDT